MDKFYCIQLISKTGDKRWIISNPPEVLVVDQYVIEVTRFDSWESANMFVKEHQLNQDGSVIVKIYSNTELMEMELPGMKPATGGLYYLETAHGEKLCVSPNGYYFKKCDVGYCVWPDPSHITPLWDEFISKGVNCSVKELKVTDK
ncbi:MAG: hypothetical protein V4547_18120 [Bacteroidota bacterium]